jgi:hypothetical protein
VTNGPSIIRKRSRQPSVVDTTTIPLAAVPNVISDLEREGLYPAKRQRLAERRAQSSILEPASTPKSTHLIDLSGQVSHPSASDAPIPGPLGAGREHDGAISLVLPLTDLRGAEDDDGAYVYKAVEEPPQARGSIPPSEWMEGEQDVSRESDRCVINRQGGGSKVGESFEQRFQQAVVLYYSSC